MSIAVCCTLADGVVLGTDSAITVSGKRAGSDPPQVLKVYNEAEKLFGLHTDPKTGVKLPVGLVTFGLATLGHRTLESFFREFELKHPADKLKLPLEKLARTVHGFFYDRYVEHVGASLVDQGKKLDELPEGQLPVLAMFLAGFSPDEPLPEAWEINVHRKDGVKCVRKPGAFGSNWGGQFDGVQRFHKGFDARVVDAVVNAVVGHFGINVVKPEQIEELTKVVEQAVVPHEYQVPFAAMPLQEGIDYVKFLLDIAILQHRFVIGAPTCGGSIRTAVVRKYEGFQWLSPSALRA